MFVFAFQAHGLRSRVLWGVVGDNERHLEDSASRLRLLSATAVTETKPIDNLVDLPLTLHIALYEAFQRQVRLVQVL